LNGCEQRFGVGVPAPLRFLSRILQLLADRQMVVDFSVKDDLVASSVRTHRLVPCGRQVDYRQPSVGEAEAELSIDAISAVIRTSVKQCARHRATGRLRIGQARGDETGDATHNRVFYVRA